MLQERPLGLWDAQAGTSPPTPFGKLWFDRLTNRATAPLVSAGSTPDPPRRWFRQAQPPIHRAAG
ncbi:hypothetical protein [Candidatus Viridilinea mediisalina]|uniref:hypothetical protein n=1 Tax=Candidatus Viridilinea mediisalina TaxID=2024553 RepID=UPI000F5B24D6|nr:hypothetical protein [Candidatus Viridilinea mediisalina]